MMEHEGSYAIGATITADNGPCGRLARVVIDPIGKVVTHGVVTSPHHHGAPRLVPVALLSSDGDGVGLNLSRQQVRDLPAVTHDSPSPATPQPPSAANR